jgi:hypothetical protein
MKIRRPHSPHPTYAKSTPLSHSLHQIPFPHSMHAIPILQEPPLSYPGHVLAPAYSTTTPRYQKWSFPSYDNTEEPLGWLNRCEHFFRTQHTPETDKVDIVGFHLTGVAQHWFYMLVCDSGGTNTISWDQFRTLCQQRFGPPLSQSFG